MPTYDYKCTKCDKTYNIFHSVFSTETQYCEADMTPLDKVFSAPPIHFKGGGWGHS